jgi:NAD+ synthase (glutamine-hydrolysing)
MKIGIAQISCVERRLDLNIKKHLKMLHEAKRLGCSYVLFPELSLTGYFPEQLREYPPTLLYSLSEDFRTFAIKNTINFTVGCPIRSEDKIYIGAITFKDDGEIILHHKRVLFEDENKHVDIGTVSPQFEISGLKFNICICAELKDMNLFMQAKDSGVDVYCVSALVTRNGYDSETQQLQNYAEQGVNVLFANHAGPQGYLTPEGRSCAWNKQGQQIGCAGGLEQLLVTDVAA